MSPSTSLVHAVGSAVLTAALLATAIAASAFPGAAAPAAAQVTTTLTGWVTDPDQHPLSGAIVRLSPSGRAALTDSEGRFRFAGIPAGNYTVSATYLGYAPRSRMVAVSAGGPNQQDLVLQADPIALQGIEVYGRLTRGQAEALNEQRTSANLQYVVNEEQFERYPDINAAETVQRLPGISIARDQGEGRYVQVRGLGQELNSLTLNGVRIPAVGRQAERSVELDLIQSSLIEEITVVKALRPDMDADALGGVVDFQLKRAGFVPAFNVEAGFGVNDQQSEISDYGRGITSLSANGSHRALDDRLGVLLSGSYHNTERGSLFESWRYVEDEGVDAWRHRTTDYDVGRERLGLLGNVDYRYSDTGELAFSFSWDRYMEDEIRRMAVYNVASSQEQRFTGNRVREQYLTFGKVDVQQAIGRATLDLEASYADGTEDWPDITEYQWSRPNPVLGTLSDEELDALGALSTFPGVDTPLMLDYVYFYPTKVETSQQTLGADFTLPVGGGESSLKAGVKLTRADRQYLYSSVRSLPAPGAPTILGGEFGFSDVRFGDPELGTIPLASPFVPPDPRTNASSYEGDETIGAGYLMATTEWADRITTLAGLRVESTWVDYRQHSTGLTGEGEYMTLLPSFHTVYRFDDATQFRAAVTRGLSRPPFSRLIPTDRVDEAELEISRGNPDLEPLKAWNYDLMFERYSSSLGFLGVGAFYKSIEDPIATGSFSEALGGEIYTVYQPLNGGSAYVYGVEFATYQPLARLGVPALRYLAVNANYTFNESQADFGDDADEDVPMPNSPRHTGNVALSYDNPRMGLSAVVAANYRSAMWEKFEGSQLHNDIWTDEEFHLDVGVTQQWNDRFATYLQLNNLTNEADREVQGEPGRSFARIHERESYSWYATLGLRYTFQPLEAR